MTENIGKYLDAEMLPDVPGRKTHRWEILTKSGDRLGMVEWYSHWRQYTFNPFHLTTYSAGCLNDLARFLAWKNVRGKLTPQPLPLSPERRRG